MSYGKFGEYFHCTGNLAIDDALAGYQCLGFRLVSEHLAGCPEVILPSETLVLTRSTQRTLCAGADAREKTLMFALSRGPRDQFLELQPAR